MSNIDPKSTEALIPKFVFVRVLDHDPAARRMSLLGSINSKPAIILAERTAFPTDSASAAALVPALRGITSIGANDIYAWFLASSGIGQAPDLKINLIWPCTEKHIAKYSPQQFRVVTETPEIYATKIRPYMAKQRDEGRLNWVFNILDGKAEQEDVMYREMSDELQEGFLVAPDLNWDRKTIEGLHVLGLVERRDIWSLRDLTKAHVPWLTHMRKKLVDATTGLYPQIRADQLKLYIHYQPTYYHFHVHVVHVGLNSGATQAVGKAFSLDNLINQLELMEDGKSMADTTITYTLGEAHDLWKEVFSGQAM